MKTSNVQKIGRISSGVSVMIGFIWAETPTPSQSMIDKLEDKQNRNTA